MYAVRGMRHSLLIFQNQCHSQSLFTRNNGILLGARAKSYSYVYGACGFSTTTANPNAKRVGTHDGSFHCDEALACFMIRLTKKFSNAQIIRTRNPQVLENFDAVVDVGGVYDPTRDRYDHHQRGFEQVFGHGFTTKLSSAGLVYKHYGAEIIAKELQLDVQHPNVHQLFLAVYKNFVEAVDAIDNGINQYDTDQPPKYVNATGLSYRVGRLNLDWIDPDQSLEKENEAFQRAMILAGSEFLESIHFHANSWLPARSIVMECLSARHNIDSSGEIMVLTRSCPWKLHIFELEEELKIDTTIKYVIYQDDRSENWRLQAVAVSPDKFESRKPLPLPWRGLEGNKLSEVAGIPGCVFVHMSGFIGANNSYEGALAMARASLKA
ncbi:Metal-dependent protein hydrolase [Corchorus olitorius]|uniref:Metal-dependent protein hydrolase n=1 Tax=Corchorus olitorius TaxID=93759 RepID=A0A1R3JFF3_9ROSI|nr:Metal-dependent protein hydrolase [Corchorus olitorius]